MTRTAIALALLAIPTLAAEVAVFPAGVVNLDEAQGDAVAQVVADAWAERSGQDTLGPIDTGDVYDRSEGQTGDQRAAAAASTLGVAQYVTVSAVRLEKKISLRARRHEVGGGVTGSAEIVAAGLDDVEAAAVRLVEALLKGASADDVRTHGTVTAREGQKRNRLFSEKVVGVRTGVVLPFASGGEFNAQALFHFDMRLEADSYFLEFGAGGAVPSQTADKEKYGGLFARVGGAIYLADGEYGPYVGLGVEPRLHLAEDGSIGFAPYAQLGLMLFRSSSTRLFVDLQVAQNVLPVDTREYEYDYSTYEDSDTVKSGGEHHPTEVGILVGIGW